MLQVEKIIQVQQTNNNTIVSTTQPVEQAESNMHNTAAQQRFQSQFKKVRRQGKVDNGPKNQCRDRRQSSAFSRGS